MPLVTCCHAPGRWIHVLSGLVLLLCLTSCAAQPSLGRPQWYGQHGPVTAEDFPSSTTSGHEPIDVDFEVSTPRQAEELRQRGILLPRSSVDLGDPRTHQDFIDQRVTAVGFGITAGGWILFCEGLPLPVLVPEEHVGLELTHAQPLNASIYSDRDAALADLAASSPGATHERYAYYRGAGGALIVPTLFSTATTPRIAQAMREVRKDLSDTVERELKVALLALTGTKVLQGVFSRVVRAAPEPIARPLSHEKGRGSAAPAPRQPEPRTTAPAPEATSASGPLAPSPGLVQALTGKNPTPPVAAGPRLPQDAAVSPKVPKPLSTERSISPNTNQNAQLQADLRFLRNIGAKNIRVNQQQVTVENGERVGINRPDVQFDYNGRRYHVEYDTHASGRGPGHQLRSTSNDPDAEIILLIVP